MEEELTNLIGEHGKKRGKKKGGNGPGENDACEKLMLACLVYHLENTNFES